MPRQFIPAAMKLAIGHLYSCGVPQESIAETLRVSQPTVSRVLADLRATGALHIKTTFNQEMFPSHDIQAMHEIISRSTGLQQHLEKRANREEWPLVPQVFV